MSNIQYYKFFLKYETSKYIIICVELTININNKYSTCVTHFVVFS